MLTTISEISVKNDGILFFPDEDDLTKSEKLQLESTSIRNRVCDLLGGKEEMRQHRDNLKRVFGSTKDEGLRKIWENLDSSLAADIKFEESLTAIN